MNKTLKTKKVLGSRVYNDERKYFAFLEPITTRYCNLDVPSAMLRRHLIFAEMPSF